MGQKGIFRHNWLRRALTRIVCLWNHTPKGRTLQMDFYWRAFENLPDAFDGYRIVQITDLHGRMFGNNQQTLIRKVAQQKPNLILITGDMIEELYEGQERRAVRALYKGLQALAPCFAILGNHEVRSEYLSEILSDLSCSRVQLLRNESVLLLRQGGQIRLSGLETGLASGLRKDAKDPEGIGETLSQMFPKCPQEHIFTVLMAHKPEKIHLYSRHDIDLIFSGHAHGGLMKLGFGQRGLLAPGQGIFPKYVQGTYEKDGTYMIVGRGLGGPRIGIPPEIVTVELHVKKPKGSGKNAV